MSNKNFKVKNNLEIEGGELLLGSTNVTVDVDGDLNIGGAKITAGAGGGVNITSGLVVPDTPSVGDQWFNTDKGILYTYVTDGTNNSWIDISTVGSVGDLSLYDTSSEVDTKIANVGGVNITSGIVVPVTPTVGDQWFNTDKGILYTYVTDGTNNSWIDISTVGTTSDVDLSIYDTSTQVNVKLQDKADQLTTYTKTEVDTVVSNNVGSGGGVNITSGIVVPVTPAVGDQWFNTDKGILYTYVTDGTNNSWIDISTVGSVGVVDLSLYDTSTQVNVKLQDKADQTTTYTKTEVDTAISSGSGGTYTDGVIWDNHDSSRAEHDVALSVVSGATLALTHDADTEELRSVYIEKFVEVPGEQPVLFSVSSDVMSNLTFSGPSSYLAHNLANSIGGGGASFLIHSGTATAEEFIATSQSGQLMKISGINFQITNPNGNITNSFEVLTSNEGVSWSQIYSYTESTSGSLDVINVVLDVVTSHLKVKQLSPANDWSRIHYPTSGVLVDIDIVDSTPTVASTYWQLESFDDWGVQFTDSTTTTLVNNTGADATIRARLTKPTALASTSGTSGSGGVNITSSVTVPSTPDVGDQWFNTDKGILYTYVTDGTDNSWIDISTVGSVGDVDLSIYDTSTQVNVKLQNKADQTTTYTKTEVDTAISSGIVSVSGINIISSDTAPVSSVVGDQWFNTDKGILYTYVTDGTNNSWIDISTVGSVGAVDLSLYDTSTQVNVKLQDKADQTTTYTKTEVDTAISSGSGGGVNITSSVTVPVTPDVGDQWFNTDKGILYTYVTDGTNNSWIDISTVGSGVITIDSASGGGGGSSTDLTTVNLTAGVIWDNHDSSRTEYDMALSVVSGATYVLTHDEDVEELRSVYIEKYVAGGGPVVISQYLTTLGDTILVETLPVVNNMTISQTELNGVGVASSFSFDDGVTYSNSLVVPSGSTEMLIKITVAPIDAWNYYGDTDEFTELHNIFDANGYYSSRELGNAGGAWVDADLATGSTSSTSMTYWTGLYSTGSAFILGNGWTPSSGNLAGIPVGYTAKSPTHAPIGTQDFCIEMWVNDMNNSGIMTYFDSGDGIHWFRNSSGQIYLYVNNVQVMGSGNHGGTPNAGAWNHIALVRENNELRHYLNGVLTQTVSSFTNNILSTYLVIGTEHSTDQTALVIDTISWAISSFRLSIGTHRYTTNFTLIPTPLFSSIEFQTTTPVYWQLDSFDDWGVQFTDSTTTTLVNNTGSDAIIRARLTKPTASASSGGVSSMGGVMTDHIIPDTNSVYDIGSAEYKVRHLFLSDNSLWIGDDHKVSIEGGKQKQKKRKKGKTPKKIFDALIGAGKLFPTEADLKIKFKTDIHDPEPVPTVDPDHADFQPKVHQWLHFAIINGMAGTVNPENIFDGTDDFEDESPETGITTNPGFPLVTTNGAVGDLWLNTTTGELYACTDATVDANIWTNTGDGTGNIIPNDPPGNPTNIVIGEQRTETSFNHTFTGGTDGDGQVTHYMVDEISGTLNGQVVNEPMTVALPEVPVGVPHQFTVAVLTGETLLSFRVRSKDNQGSYSTGETITFNGTIIPPVGEIIISNFGSNTWVAPSGVTSVSVVAVGGGGGATSVGAGGGGLGWKNNITVVPGQSYTIVVGAGGSPGVPNTAGGNSTAFGVTAYGASGANPQGHGQGSQVTYYANGGGYGGADGGGNGGRGFGGYAAYYADAWPTGSGGGGAGGYSGNGGMGINGSGGHSGQGGGGVGIFGEGSNGIGGQGSNSSNWVNNGGGDTNAMGSGGGGGGGAGGVHQYETMPTGGSGGGSGGQTYGGQYGGGGGGGVSSTGGTGVVRIIWGENRSFPSTNVDLASSTP